MRIRRYLTASWLVAGLLLAACGVETGEKDPAVDSILFRSDRFHFEVAVPSGWAVADGHTGFHTRPASNGQPGRL